MLVLGPLPKAGDEGTYAQHTPIVAMILDVEQVQEGFFVWCKVAGTGQSLLVRVQDFQPYWFIPSPVPVNGAEAHSQWPHSSLALLRNALNRRLASDCQIMSITEHPQLKPIMYYRPLGSTPFLQLHQAANKFKSLQKAANQVHALCRDGVLEADGFKFPVRQSFESEVKPLNRFMSDAGISGGGWVFLPPASQQAITSKTSAAPSSSVPATPVCQLPQAVGAQPVSFPSSVTPSQHLDTPMQPQLAPEGGRGYALVPPHERISTADVEVIVPWNAITPLTPDATQMADMEWMRQRESLLQHFAEKTQPAIPQHWQQQQQQQPPPFLPPLPQHQLHEKGPSASVAAALQAALSQQILPLRTITLDVQLATSDGTAHSPNPSQADPIVAIACESLDLSFGDGGGAAVQSSVVFLLAGPVCSPAAPSSSQQQQKQQQQHQEPRVLWLGRTRLELCCSESDLLSRWRFWFSSVDPDCVATFQVRDTLGALAKRAEACQLPPQHVSVVDASPSQHAGSLAAKVSGSAAFPGQGNGVGELHLSRLKPGHRSLPLSTKSIVTYSPSWVKSQSRMASTSNQETFAAEGMSGRLVFDLLRQVIISQSLATFSLVDCVQSLLGRTIEVLSPRELTGLWQGIVAQEGSSPGKTEGDSGEESYEAVLVLKEGRADSGSGHKSGAGRRGPPSTGIPVAAGRVSKESKGSRGKLTSSTGGRGRGRGQGQGRSGGRIYAAAGMGPKKTAGTVDRLFPAGPQCHPNSSGSSSNSKGDGEMAASKALMTPVPVVRLARYSMARTEAVLLLLQQLATIPECFEMARVTGLSISQVAYKAQMSRTWSLLLRCARRSNYVIGGKQEQGQLTESPFLLHPVESGTAALYSSPVAVLDFASLYPSIYRAHNLCYTTLVVPEDIEHVGMDNVVRSPSGHYFAMPHLQQGILPSILAALVTARTRTRAALDALPSNSSGAAAQAVLDSRQKALKVVANALYGFTGAPASPLQCVPLADSCLAFGAQSCRMAMNAVPQLLSEVSNGPEARGGRVIYAQTDSLFVNFPAATAHQACLLGEKLAKLVTERYFKHPIELRFENVFKPFLLLHVNRYAGRSFANAQQAAMDREPPQPSQLQVKGVKSMWRQSAPIVQNCLQGVLERMLLHNNIPGAVAFAEGEIQRLLTGRVFMWELIMNGGLWRVTGAQVAQEALAPGSEDVRGPHAALAIKLAQRDPHRPFLLGERVPYVLLSGFRLQDEAAEDPLLASEIGLVPNLDLYYHNKLKVPLEEIMQKVLKPTELNHLLSGSHTSVRIEPPLAGSAEATAGSAAAAGIGGAAGPTDSLAMKDISKSGKSTGGRQSGLTGFFKAAPKCLSCKQPIPSSQQQVPGSQLTPGLCSACLELPGRWVAIHQQHLAEANAQHQLLAATVSRCLNCHSGGLCGAIACSNGECHVLHTRLGAVRNLATEQVRLERVQKCEPVPALTW